MPQLTQHQFYIAGRLYEVSVSINADPAHDINLQLDMCQRSSELPDTPAQRALRTHVVQSCIVIEVQEIDDGRIRR